MKLTEKLTLNNLKYSKNKLKILGRNKNVFEEYQEQKVEAIPIKKMEPQSKKSDRDKSKDLIASILQKKELLQLSRQNSIRYAVSTRKEIGHQLYEKGNFGVLTRKAQLGFILGNKSSLSSLKPRKIFSRKKSFETHSEKYNDSDSKIGNRSPFHIAKSQFENPKNFFSGRSGFVYMAGKQNKISWTKKMKKKRKKERLKKETKKILKKVAEFIAKDVPKKDQNKNVEIEQTQRTDATNDSKITAETPVRKISFLKRQTPIHSKSRHFRSMSLSQNQINQLNLKTRAKASEYKFDRDLNNGYEKILVRMKMFHSNKRKKDNKKISENKE